MATNAWNYWIFSPVCGGRPCGHAVALETRKGKIWVRNCHRKAASAEITRNFGYWQDRAARGPLTITHHGRPRYVLLTVDEWKATKEGTAGGAGKSRREAEYDFLVEHMDGGLLVVDSNLRISEVSSAAALLMGEAIEDLVGEPVGEVMVPPVFGPAVSGLRQVLRTGKEAHFDLPLGARGKTRLRVRAFAWVDGLAMLLNVSHEESENAHFAEQQALEKARDAHGVIAVLRLSVRATIAAAEPRFAALVGLPPERVLGARFVDLMAIADRPVARDAVEAILGGRADSQAFDGNLLTNDGVDMPVRISIAPLTEGYAASGAMMIVTASPGGQVGWQGDRHAAAH